MSTRILYPGLGNAYPFPFPIETGSEWDGVTYVQNGTATFYDAGTPTEFPFYTPGLTKVGPGTLYPFGMSLNDLDRVVKRVRSWDWEQTGSTPRTGILYPGDNGTGSEACADEGDIATKYGLILGSGWAALSAEVFLSIFIGGYNLISHATVSSPSVNDEFPIITGWAFTGDPTAYALDWINGGTVIKRGDLYYPLAIFGKGMYEPDPSVTVLMRGNSPTEDAPNATATLTFDPITTTFTGTAPGGTLSYGLTMAPRKYWSYGGTYDVDTGAPL